MRVLLTCSWFLKYAVPQAAALEQAGVDVALLCRDRPDEFDGSVEEFRQALDEVRGAGVEVFSVPGRVSSIKALPFVARVFGEVRRWKPDIVHAHVNDDPRLLAVTRGYPLVLTVHDVQPHLGAPPVGRMHEAISRQWIRLADRIVVHGEALAEQLTATYGRGGVVVVPHGTTPRSRPFPPPAEKAVLLFGRLEHYKGIRVLLDAMEIVWRERPEIKLLVAGKGPDAHLVPRHPRVEVFRGYLPESKVDELFHRASLVALPYLEASQSGVGLLAVGCGVPLVVSSVGSLPELAVDPSFVVQTGDSEALARTLLLHIDHDNSVRRRVLELAENAFSWQVAAELSLELYRSLIPPVAVAA